jgi:hypothetical protein
MQHPNIVFDMSEALSHPELAETKAELQRLREQVSIVLPTHLQRFALNILSS